MAVLPIVAWPDPRLRQVCDPVPFGADRKALIADMFETMYAAPGRGLAGPQVGVMERLFVMDVTWKEGEPTPVACINPEIVERSEAHAVRDEACLSIVGVAAAVSRPAEVVLRWFDADWHEVQARLSGFHATCAQHEYDHLDGRVILDHQTPEVRAILEQAYAGGAG
jgi:peptide deformylase